MEMERRSKGERGERWAEDRRAKKQTAKTHSAAQGAPLSGPRTQDRQHSIQPRGEGCVHRPPHHQPPATSPPGSAKKKKTGRTQAGKNEKGAFRCLLNPALVSDKKRSISKPISTLRMPHIPPPVFFFSIKVTSLFPPVSSQVFFFFFFGGKIPSLCVLANVTFQ